jgi:hypothetical protein
MSFTKGGGKSSSIDKSLIDSSFKDMKKYHYPDFRDQGDQYKTIKSPTDG